MGFGNQPLVMFFSSCSVDICHLSSVSFSTCHLDQVRLLLSPSSNTHAPTVAGLLAFDVPARSPSL